MGAIVNPTNNTIMLLFLTVIPLIIQDVVAARQMTSDHTLTSLDAFQNIEASAIPPKP